MYIVTVDCARMVKISTRIVQILKELDPPQGRSTFLGVLLGLTRFYCIDIMMIISIRLCDWFLITKLTHIERGPGPPCYSEDSEDKRDEN